MCGLLAFFSARGDAGAHRDAISSALECLHHRGPDETGVEVVADASGHFADAVFAHKRLAIIDVASSQEPLAYANGRYLLTFNGEIYNYIELREQLIREFGAEFATQGDGEVIVAGYHYWGEAVLKRLRGMFAFVIWDREQRRAFAARDYFGIKPLHYLQTADGVYLASEKKALLPFSAAANTGDAGIDTANLSHYLTLQYVPEPGTLHRGINRIGSGESLTWSAAEGARVRRWYRPVFHPGPVDDPQKLYDRIRETLRESVRMHMRSDVPVGSFLSSGIDSTAVVALAREFNPNILTFTVGYDVPGYSEIDVAQDSARHLGVTTIPTKIGPQDMIDALPKIVWHLDDPVADPALVPLYFVAKKAAEHVTVVLSGEGADEFFGGYTIYREPLSLNAVNSLPDSMQKGLRAVSKVIPQGVKGKSFLERGTTPIEERYYGNARMFTEEEKRQLLRRYDPSVRYTDVTAPIYAEVPELDDVTKMQYVDLYTWLRGDILVKADRISMAHSLEVRVPFLDREVFEVASIIPVDLKLPPRSDATKYAMRQALMDVVPPPIVNRRKLGFPTPTRVWLRGEMYEWARHVLATSGAGELLDLSYAMRLLEEHKREEADHSRKVWTVLIFCIWHAIFVERSLDPGIQRNQSALLTKPVVGSMVS
ncbi:asparagine synthase (glutamine-hydrolysing) [Micromonospora pattaloongensis]|uniref:asparagine synthase (glutamine-hydrolyzing) n=1 Tax=Micromonospora pattaloongensis TaxID=405436 RepID=A0A1H3QEQ0_9ACTN|nr:asparagine synthase (glutamine-hydrolyzing) [Micromonospora pattaloongensis]SDZ11495.1 asparagine synthase (glutamine-hydrolysing) [Micromonospora pattaloongensis]